MTDAAPADPVATARDVLRAEGEALLAMADAPPDGFAETVDLLAGVAGRIVVSGMGKSGHVARKVAATLASTGSPALFVHPGEASHGDLGMMSRGDAALLLSNSGETSELGDVVAHTRRFAIPMVAITSRADSTLARAADRALILPPQPEACGLGVVPTTSTTMALALGDALAVALLRRRGFRAEDFGALHPGGRLGAQLSRVAQLMRAPVPSVDEAAPMSEALVAMTAGGFGLTAVTAVGGLVGIITDGDLRRNMDRLMARRAGEIATHDPSTVDPETLAASALAVMHERKITALIVCEGRAPVGVLHMHDLLRAGVA